MRALLAAPILFQAGMLVAESPTYTDGSEADVYYYSVEDGLNVTDGPSALPAEHDIFPGPQRGAEQASYEQSSSAGEYEPGVFEPSNFTYGGCESCGSAGCACEAGCDPACGGCGGCGGCCKPDHPYYARGEYLMWWMSGATAPPLLTTSPNGTPITDAGVLPDAEILFPDDRLEKNGRPGGRFTVGRWFNDGEWAVEGSYFFLDKASSPYSVSSDDNGSPIIARPFIDADTGDNDAFIVAYPNVFSGTATVANASDLLGAEANIRKAVLGNHGCRMDLLAGYRFLRLRESLSVYENQTSIDQGGVIPLGTHISIQDDFAMNNTFHGGQVGILLEKQCCRWTIEGTGKVAFGSWEQQARIGGVTTVTVPNVAPVVEEGGILALPSNIGNYSRNRFAAIPELSLNLRYQLTRCWKVNVGYTFMYLQRIVRPGNNVDLRIDTDQIPPPLSAGSFPEFKFKESDAWLQGVNIGLECRF
jgi:hypothetical protein